MKRTPKDIAEKKARATLEVNRKLRGNWGEVNPVTKVIPDKRKKDPKYPTAVIEE